MAQGTIKLYDEETKTGLLLMDDATEVEIDNASTDGSGLRSLRLGQRVRFDLNEEGGRKIARSLNIVTM